MSVLDRFHYRPVQFAKDGSLVEPSQVDQVAQLADEVSDLLVISHGWNNDMEEAERLYERFATSLDRVRDDGLRDRTFGICGVLWPSKRFAESELIPGGAASAAPVDPTLADDLLAMQDAFDSDDASEALREAASLVPELERSASAQREYADLLRSLVGTSEEEEADALGAFFRLSGDELVDRLDQAALDLMADAPVGEGGVVATARVGSGATGGGAEGGALGFFDSIASKGRMLLNMVTYYVMKERAGTIGSKSLGPVLREQIGGKTRLHLAGHSFGARLVTAAAAAQPRGSVSSLSLLQAAFSHNAFAKDWEPGKDGFFRAMVTKKVVDGPVIITHTRNDVAVGIAYAMASRIAGQNASAIGDKDSQYGGLGSNGARHTPEASDAQPLAAATGAYAFEAGTIYNLLADEFVSGHGDVSGIEVANAVLHAMTAGH